MLRQTENILAIILAFGIWLVCSTFIFLMDISAKTQWFFFGVSGLVLIGVLFLCYAVTHVEADAEVEIQKEKYHNLPNVLDPRRRRNR
jgi:hypothetical protein